MDASCLLIISGEQEIPGTLDELQMSLKNFQGHSDNVSTSTSNSMSLNLHLLATGDSGNML